MFLCIEILFEVNNSIYVFASVGYGWRLGYIQERSSIWHGGLIDGFMSMAMYLPNEDVFVAVFSNCDCKSPQDVIEKRAAIAIGKPYET